MVSFLLICAWCSLDQWKWGWRCRPWGFRSIMAIDLNLFKRGQDHVMFLFGCRYSYWSWESTILMLDENLPAKREYCLRDKNSAYRLDSMVSWLWWFGMGSRRIISGKLIAELIKQKARYRMSGWRSLSTIMWVLGARTRWLLSLEAGIRRGWRPREKVGDTGTNEKNMLESMVWVGKNVG